MQHKPTELDLKKIRAMASYLDASLEMNNQQAILVELKALLETLLPDQDASRALFSIHNPKVVELILETQGDEGLSCIRDARGQICLWRTTDILDWPSNTFLSAYRLAGHIDSQDQPWELSWQSKSRLIARVKEDALARKNVSPDLEYVNELMDLFGLSPNHASFVMWSTALCDFRSDTQWENVPPSLANLAARILKACDYSSEDFEKLVKRSIEIKGSVSEKANLQVLMAALSLGENVRAYDLQSELDQIENGQYLLEKLSSAHGLMELRGRFRTPEIAFSTPSEEILAFVSPSSAQTSAAA